MRKFRDWMHGEGRKIIMVAVIVAALCIVGNYFFVVRGGHWGPTPTQSPKPTTIEDTLVGGEQLQVAPKGTPKEIVMPSPEVSP